MMRLLWLILVFTMVLQSWTFELQDTIHKLIEENIHLHDQLENLTQALRELRWMLIHHSNDPGHEHDVHDNKNVQHLWKEWSQHSISAETHLLLEQAFCGYDLHDSAALPHESRRLWLLPLPGLILLLMTSI